MRIAVGQLNPAPDFLLLDAIAIEVAVPQRSLIKGDARCHAIAAASILAKTARDACMRVWDEVFPAYGLASHKGYSTPRHVAALREHGPSPLHRQSFAPVWQNPVPQEVFAFLEDDEPVEIVSAEDLPG